MKRPDLRSERGGITIGDGFNFACGGCLFVAFMIFMLPIIFGMFVSSCLATQDPDLEKSYIRKSVR